MNLGEKANLSSGRIQTVTTFKGPFPGTPGNINQFSLNRMKSKHSASMSAYPSSGFMFFQFGMRPGEQWSRRALRQMPLFQSVVKFLILQSGRTAFSQASISFLGGKLEAPSWQWAISDQVSPKINFKLPLWMSVLPEKKDKRKPQDWTCQVVMASSSSHDIIWLAGQKYFYADQCARAYGSI